MGNGCTAMSKKAVFLDRDGVLNLPIVINKKPYPPKNLKETRLVPDVKKACNNLKKAGFILIVVTNQPDVARKIQKKETVENINNWLKANLPIDEFRVCYHDDKDNCFCRKPKAGLILKAAKKHNINLAKSFVIGDRYKDIEAGKKAGCKTIFIDYKYNEKLKSKPNYTASSVIEAAKWILKQKGEKNENSTAT